MKVVYLAAGSEGTLGGETRVAMELAYAMSQLGETAIVFTGTKNQISKSGNLTKVTLEGSDFEKSENIGVFTPNTIKFFFDFLDSFKPDVMHSHSAWLAPFIGQVWAINNSVPYFYTTHYMPSKIASFFDLTPNSFASKMMNEMFFKQHLLGYLDNCSCVIALNTVAKEDITDYGYKGDIVVLPNGRTLEPLNSLRLAKQSSKERVIGFVGTISKRKNQEYLLKVMKYLPANYRLKLAGRFLFEGYETEFRNLSKKYSNVEVLGPIAPDKVKDFLESLHIFVSASKTEVQALSVLEALASGRPIVGLSNETIDEFVDSSVGTWLDGDTSPKEFAKYVERVGKLSSSEYEKMCNSAREKVSHLDWSKIASRTFNLYSTYIEKGRSLKRRSNIDAIADMIIRLPHFPGQSYLLSQTNSLKSHNYNTKPFDMVRKVPKKTLLFAGLTLGAATAIFGVVKALQYAKKISKKGRGIFK